MKLSLLSFRSSVIAAAMVLLGTLGTSLHGQVAVRNQGFVPFSDDPINYRAPVNDPVARLQRRLDSGEATLQYEPKHGYLKSVLDQLSIPVSSQTLVFSKTSFQYKKISPQLPRALYFNDDVYVGQVHDGKVLEFVSFDARQGAIFYILDEQEADRPRFERAELDCTQCHVAAGTRNVPGVLLRSILPTPTGTQTAKSASFITGHQSPFSERWGGWYVSGTSGRQTHMGNAVAEDPQHAEQFDRTAGTNLTNFSSRFDTSAYLIPDSDIVAHLVLGHQTQMHNLITLTNYQTRIAQYGADVRNRAIGQSEGLLSDAERAQYEKPAEELVRYLLFADEVLLTDPVSGTSSFASDFSAKGPRDRHGRSLRDFDLHTRIFKYPCSYLIYSEDFDALPAAAKDYVYRRLLEVLTGRDESPAFARLTAVERQDILDILVATKPGLPAEWKKYGKT